MSDERGVFYKHDYTAPELDELFSRQPWEIVTREFAAAKDPRIERWYTGHLPWSSITGPFLRFVCPSNFVTSGDPSVIATVGEGVAYLHLRKPARAD